MWSIPHWSIPYNVLALKGLTLTRKRQSPFLAKSVFYVRKFGFYVRKFGFYVRKF